MGRPRIRPKRRASPLYKRTVALIEAERQRRGLSYADLDAMAGFRPKVCMLILNPDSPSGRFGSWQRISRIIELLWGPDFEADFEVAFVARG